MYKDPDFKGLCSNDRNMGCNGYFSAHCVFKECVEEDVKERLVSCACLRVLAS